VRSLIQAAIYFTTKSKASASLVVSLPLSNLTEATPNQDEESLKLIDPTSLIQWLKYFPNVRLKVVNEEEIAMAEQNQKDLMEQKRGVRGIDRDKDRKDGSSRLGESSRKNQVGDSSRKHRATSSVSENNDRTHPPRVVGTMASGISDGRGRADGKKRTLFEP
jgi:hypothetical protein